MIQKMISRLLTTQLDRIAKRDSSCTGSSQECEKPAASSYKKAVILGVLIPVAVIIILFSAIFIHLRKKSNKEKFELEADPQFDGNLEFYEYDTPQIARTFNEVNNNLLVSNQNNIDYEKEAEYEKNQQRKVQSQYNNNSNGQKGTSHNPFE
ncbi:hypothetical protein QEN19_003221 [Hanseniaspora menglaensis]